MEEKSKLTKEEAKTVGMLYDRWKAMDEDRNTNGNADKWESYRKKTLLIKDDISKLANWQSKIKVWVSFGLVETVVATVLENNPTVVFKHENPAYNELDEIYNDAFSYTWRRSTLEFYDFLCDIATYGKGYWYEFYRKEMGEQDIPIGFKKNKDGIVTSFDVENL